MGESGIPTVRVATNEELQGLRNLLRELTTLTVVDNRCVTCEGEEVFVIDVDPSFCQAIERSINHLNSDPVRIACSGRDANPTKPHPRAPSGQAPRPAHDPR